MNSKLRSGSLRLVAVATLTVLGTGCSDAMTDAAAGAEALGSSQEELTRNVHERSDIKVYTTEAGAHQVLIESGFHMCPPNYALAGIEQIDGTKAIACKNMTGSWDPNSNATITNAGAVNASWTGFESPLPLHGGTASNQQEILTYQSSPFRYAAVGVNFTTGTLKFRIVPGSGGSSVVTTRSDTNSYVHYTTASGGIQEIHVCPASSPIIHGANVKYNTSYPNPYSNGKRLWPFDFSCFSM